MKIAELRQYLFSFEDTPRNRSELKKLLEEEEGSDEIAWGYAEGHIEGFLAWSAQQSQIMEALERHNNTHKSHPNYEEHRFKLKNLSGADLSAAYLTDADLSGADLSGADLSAAYLKYPNLRGANLSGADLSAAYLRYPKLNGADLSDADLTNTDLTNADLTNADLKGAKLTYTNLRGAFLLNASLRNTDLTGAQYDEGTYFPEGFDPEDSGMQRRQRR